MEFGYLAFVFALALACVAGMEFVYLMFVESQNRQLKKAIKTLERRNAALTRALEDAEQQLAELSEADEREDAWPELIDEK